MMTVETERPSINLGCDNSESDPVFTAEKFPAGTVFVCKSLNSSPHSYFYTEYLVVAWSKEQTKMKLRNTSMSADSVASWYDPIKFSEFISEIEIVTACHPFFKSISEQETQECHHSEQNIPNMHSNSTDFRYPVFQPKFSEMTFFEKLKDFFWG